MFGGYMYYNCKQFSTLHSGIVEAAPEVRSNFTTGVKFSPMFEKRHKNGEDAYVEQDSMMVVCDGVGGWINKGIEVGHMSRELAANIGRLHSEDKNKMPYELLKEAAELQTKLGSTTVVITKLD
jgi:serine/threonine protein phosphatase PrpC